MKVIRGTLAGLGLLLASGAAGQTPDLSGRDPHWIKDPQKDCWAANPDPEPGETVSWMGACVDGLLSGEGTLTWYLNGRLVGRDEGSFKRGELSGHGRITQAGGASFEGEFPGKGVLTLPDGRKVAAVAIKETAGWSIEESQAQR